MRSKFEYDHGLFPVTSARVKTNSDQEDNTDRVKGSTLTSHEVNKIIHLDDMSSMDGGPTTKTKND